MAARLVAAAGIPHALRALPWRSRHVTILAYHRIYDMGDEATFPFDPELVSATPADFAAQMQWVRRWGTPLTFRRLGEALDSGRLPRRPVLVTFDDGHLDNYTEAFPILQAAGVPATIFLSTGYVSGRGTFWFDRVAHLLFRAPGGVLRLARGGFEAPLGDVASRREAAGRLLEKLKRVPDADRLAALADLESQLGRAAPPADARHSAALTWDHVREMAAAGVEFGSHAVSHPVLTMQDDRTLAYELEESKRAIEEHTGTDVTAVAYPVGGPGAFDERVVAAVRAAGYRFGVSYVSGVNPLCTLAPYALKRLHVERYTSAPLFKSVLALPGLFA